MSFTLLALLIAAGAMNLQAATFVVPKDADLIQRSDLIVTGTALQPYSRISADGGIETVTPVVVNDVLKGGTSTTTIDVVEPGGHLGQLFTIIPGSPQFTRDEQLLLLLKQIGDNQYAVTELVLGKFRFETDTRGHRVAVRDADEIRGWDTQLRPYQERMRLAEPFVDFVRQQAVGKHPAEQYFLDMQAPLQSTSTSTAPRATVNATYSATSYTMTISGSQGSRWSVFPSAVTFYSNSSGEPGAPGGGVTAVQAGIAAWDNDPGSNVNYVYGGTDSTHTQGLHGPDGANTVLFERDLSSWGVSPFTCSGSSYGGTLGLGGVTSASGSNTVNGETFVTTREGDVEMNRGIANCTLLFNSGDFNTAVAHELGHTLGFRHSDQNRASSGSCSSDPTLECSSSAIMRSSVPNGINATLQQWDINAVRAVYPGTTNPPPPTCTAPSVSASASPTSITSGGSSTLTAHASGTTPLSYQWYVGSSGNTASPISGATSSSVTVRPASTTSYWVRVSNACGTANSNTVTVSVTTTPPPPPPPTRRKVAGDYDGDSKADIAVFRPSIGYWYIQGTTVGFKAVLWGGPGDIPTPADYDGDRKTDVALFRPSNGNWYISPSGGAGTAIVAFGSSGDTPVPADYDGDGKDDIAVFRASTGYWYIRPTSTLAFTAVLFGGPGDIPVPADYDGDGKADIAIWRPSNGNWYIRPSRGGATITAAFGSNGDTPFPADYDGDRKADIAVFRPSNGDWYVRASSTNAMSTNPWGGAGDIPVPADYDGNGAANIGIFRPSTGYWYIRSGPTRQFGQAGDIPVTK